MLDKGIAIMGYSGHAYVVLDACQALELPVHYYCDDEIKNTNPFRLEYIGDERHDAFDWNVINDVVLGIGDNVIRKKVFELLLSKNKKVKTIIHPSSNVSELTTIGKGTFVSSGTNINVLSKVGDNCIINTGAILEHECIVGNHSHIAPGAVLLGNVTIGNNCFIGANAVVKENTVIEDNVTVGAGSVVLKNIGEGQTAVGNPVRQIR